MVEIIAEETKVVIKAKLRNEIINVTNKLNELKNFYKLIYGHKDFDQYSDELVELENLERKQRELTTEYRRLVDIYM